MDNLIDKIKDWFTPTTPPSEDSLKDLQAKTQKLEQQAKYAETEAQLIDRANKAKKRIKTARRGSSRRWIFILAGLVFLVIIILVMKGSC